MSAHDQELADLANTRPAIVCFSGDILLQLSSMPERLNRAAAGSSKTLAAPALCVVAPLPGHKAAIMPVAWQCEPWRVLC